MCSFSAHSQGPMYIINTSHYNGYLFLRLMQKLRAWSPWRPSDPHSPREGSNFIYKGLSERKEGNAAARSKWRFCHRLGGLHGTRNTDRQSADPCEDLQSVEVCHAYIYVHCNHAYCIALCYRPQKLCRCRTDHNTCMASAHTRYVLHSEIWATRQCCPWQQQC